jgi:hypothetical protein
LDAVDLPAPHAMTVPQSDALVAGEPVSLLVWNWEQTLTGDVQEAGSTVMSVTAQPVRQTWTFYDRTSDSTQTVSCEGPGVSAVYPGSCVWSPPRSSADQPDGLKWQADHAEGARCFYTEVVVEWSMVVDDIGTFPGFSGSSTCLPGAGPMEPSSATTDATLERPDGLKEGDRWAATWSISGRSTRRRSRSSAARARN